MKPTLLHVFHNVGLSDFSLEALNAEGSSWLDLRSQSSEQYRGASRGDPLIYKPDLVLMAFYFPFSSSLDFLLHLKRRKPFLEPALRLSLFQGSANYDLEVKSNLLPQEAKNGFGRP